MNDSAVFAPAQCSAARANPSATTSWAPNFARLLSPSERLPGDLDEVVGQTDQPGGDRDDDHEESRTGERCAGSGVPDQITGDECSEHGEAPHGRGPGFRLMGRRAVLADRLAESLPRELADEDRCPESRHDEREAPGRHEADHLEPLYA